MQATLCVCRNAYQPSPASRLPQKRSGARCGCTCGSWLASDADDPLCLQERVAAIAGKPAPTGAGWRRVWVHLWELACQRCRRLVVSAGTRSSHRRQAGAHRGGVVQGVGALVEAGLPAMQTPRCACRNAYQPSPAIRLPQGAEWRRVWVHLWELACQRCRRLVVPAGTRINHRRQAGAHRGGVAQGVGVLVGAGLPAMQTTGFV